MKNIIRLALPLFALIVLFAACETMAPLPETEYEQAKNLRTRIQTLKFSPYAPEEWEAGEADFAAGEATYEKDNGASKKSFDSAIVNYKEVIHKAVVARSQSEEEGVNLWKKKSDDLKATVMFAEDYQAAADTLAKAQAAAAEDDWETAAELYAEAEEQFQQVYEAVKVEKDKAQTQYDSTDKILDGLSSDGGTDKPSQPIP